MCVRVGVPVLVRVCVTVRVAVDVRVRVTVGVIVTVRVTVGVRVCVGVGVRVLVGVLVGVAVTAATLTTTSSKLAVPLPVSSRRATTLVVLGWKATRPVNCVQPVVPVVEPRTVWVPPGCSTRTMRAVPVTALVLIQPLRLWLLPPTTALLVLWAA